MEKQKQHIKDCLSNAKPKLKLINDKKTKHTHSVYNPSFESQNFLSEDGRIFYGESLLTDEDDLDSDIPRLSELSLNTIIHNYKAGKLSQEVGLQDYVVFGENCDIEIELDKISELDNDLFWKRVAEHKCKNRLRYFRNCKNLEIPWKQMGIESKLSEILETTRENDWDILKLSKIVESVSPYVYYLEINQLLPRENFDLISEHPAHEMTNIPMEDCHHGSLEVLSGLTNLRELVIEIGLKNIGRNYKKHFFEFSIMDTQHLGKGLKSLKCLEIFRMRHSKMNCQKLKIITKSLEKLNIKVLEFSYCNLGDDCGISLGQFLIRNSNVTDLELKGNELGHESMVGLGYGIRNNDGCLNYLALSRNPLGENGLLAIGSGFYQTNNVKILDISGCPVGGANGAFRACQVIGMHEVLEEYNISNLPCGEVGGIKLISLLKVNRKMCRLEVRECGLTENQELKLKLLIERNNYFRENPCLNKDYIAEEDIPEIEDWLNRTKHSLMQKLAARTDSIDSFNIETRKKFYNHEVIPAFITEEQRKVKTTAEMLHVKNYYDCFGIDEKMKSFDYHGRTSEVIPKKLDFIPNEFDEGNIMEHVSVGQTINLECKHYFNPQ